MNRISWQVVPPGGWQFQYGPHWIKGMTKSELIVNVTNHCASNNFPIGNVEEEIEAQIIKLHPEMEVNKPR